MRYLIALVCPPAAVALCHRWGQAGVVLVLFGLGIVTIRAGWGVIPLTITVIWALQVVGDDRAAAVTRRFNRTVRPLRWRI